MFGLIKVTSPPSTLFITVILSLFLTVQAAQCGCVFSLFRATGWSTSFHKNLKYETEKCVFLSGKSGKQTDEKICRKAFHLKLVRCLLLEQLNYTIGFLIHFSIICSVIVVTNVWCKIGIMFRSPSIHSAGNRCPTSSIQLHMLLSLSAGSITTTGHRSNGGAAQWQNTQISR